jgi:uncharacterized protein YecT (DUF1311 family)
MFSAKLLSLTAAAVLFAAASVAVPQAGGTAPARAAKLSPFLIHETFTPLPCSGSPGHRTTLQQEGCSEQQILRSDAQINTLAKTIFPLLPRDQARRRFNAAQRAWLGYRQADCLSMSDVFAGGSESPVVAAQCDASRNAQRIKDLRAFRGALSHTG